jgi:hypothetical protein
MRTRKDFCFFVFNKFFFYFFFFLANFYSKGEEEGERSLICGERGIEKSELPRMIKFALAFCCRFVSHSYGIQGLCEIKRGTMNDGGARG